MIKRPFLAICSILLAQLSSFAQLAPGFIPEEARDMSALCTTYTFDDLYGDDHQMIPEGYTRIYTSVPTPLDNKFDVYIKNGIGIIGIRGSTADMMSWMVNAYSTMIPIQGIISINGEQFDYRFADDTSAAVHAGYSVAIATIADDVLGELVRLGEQGITNVIITGHSQGGAVAHLLRAYLEHVPAGTLPTGMRFKTYAFASPMVGDAAFAAEYEKKFCTRLSSYSIVNPEDLVPSLPLSYKEGSMFTMENLVSAVRGGVSNAKNIGRNGLMDLLGQRILGIAKFGAGPVERRMEDVLGEVVLPEIRNELNFHPMAEQIDLEPFPYPMILKDPAILDNDSIMRVEPRDEMGFFVNQSLYKEAPNSFHHKPYNYHVAILRKWFPEEYESLEVKILPENL